MIKFIDQFIKKISIRKLQQLQGKEKREKQFMNLKDVRNVLLLFYVDSFEKYDRIYGIINFLKKEGMNVFSVLYVEKGVVCEQKRINMLAFTKKECSLFFEPTVTLVDDIQSLETDLLIDLSLVDCLPLEFLAQQSVAKCKVSRKKESVSVCDLMIETNQNETSEEQLLETILFYLNHIKS